MKKSESSSKRWDMAGEWLPAKLGDYIEVKHGFAFDGEYFSDEDNRKVLLTPGNFEIGGGFKGNKLKYYNGPIPEDYILKGGDLIVTMTDLSKKADTLGYPARVPRKNDYIFLHNQRLGKIIIKSKEIDKPYLYHLLRSNEYREEILASASGTSIKHTAPKRIESFKFLMPPKSEQIEIAAILDCLEDKIALNQRMNDTLEGIAQALFKSWFVDFDPVKAKAEGRKPEGMDEATATLFPSNFIESPLGPIPEGWEASPIGASFKLTMGQSPPGETYNENGEGVPFFQGRTDFGFRFPIERIYCTAPTRFAEQNDTLVSVRAPVGDVNMAWDRCCIGRGVAALRHNTGAISFTYYTAKQLQAQFKNFNGEGTVFGSINKTDFEKLPHLEPKKNIISLFETIAGTIDSKIRNNEEQIQTLSSARDLLLPRLISGKLRISDLPEETAAS